MSPEEIRARVAALSKPEVVREEFPLFGEAFFRKADTGVRFEIQCLQEEFKEKNGRGLPLAIAIAFTLCDKDGNLVYPDPEEGIKAVKALPPEIMAELVETAARLAGLSAKALEDAEKKS